MCSIVIGRSTAIVRELVKLNKSRGSHSFSIFYIDEETYHPWYAHKSLGELHTDKIDIPAGCFAIIHQQAPTTKAKDTESIHPSSLAQSHLWHNGIIKADCCDKIREDLGVDYVWDTKLLHTMILRGKSLSSIDGSFACVEYIERKGVYVFRNEISPMFYDGESFSSSAFDGAKQLLANNVYRMRYEDDGVHLHIVDSFKTKMNPYYFGE